MARVGLKHREAPVRQLASLRRQAAIMEPELRRGEVVHGGSGRAATGLKVLVGTATGGIQAAGQDVGLDPLVPLIGQELLEPPREAVKLLGGELGDGGLKFFDAHNVVAYRSTSADGKRVSGKGPDDHPSGPPAESEPHCTVNRGRGPRCMIDTHVVRSAACGESSAVLDRRWLAWDNEVGPPACLPFREIG